MLCFQILHTVGEIKVASGYIRNLGQDVSLSEHLCLMKRILERDGGDFDVGFWPTPTV